MSRLKVLTLIMITGLTICLGVGSLFIPVSDKVIIDKKVAIQQKEQEETKNEDQQSTGNLKNIEEKDSNIVSDGNTTNLEEVDINDNLDSTQEKNIIGAEVNESTNTEINNDTNIESNSNVTDEEHDNNKTMIQKPSNSNSLNDSQENSEVIETPIVTPKEPSTSNESNYISEIEQLIFQRVNKERVAAGLSELSYNTTMEHYARIKSKDMGDNEYFSHEDLQGQLITQKMKNDGVSYNAWGENIAYIQGIKENSILATQFMDNWMNSSGHRANILSSKFNSIGIGVYKIGNTYYATQEFYR